MKSHNDTAYAALPPSYAAAHGDFEDLDLDAPGRVQGGALRRWFEHARRGLFLSSVAMLLLVMGFCLGRSHEHRVRGGGGSAESMAAAILGAGAGGGLLPQQAFVPESMSFFFFRSSRSGGKGETVYGLLTSVAHNSTYDRSRLRLPHAVRGHQRRGGQAVGCPHAE